MELIFSKNACISGIKNETSKSYLWLFFWVCMPVSFFVRLKTSMEKDWNILVQKNGTYFVKKWLCKWPKK